MPKVKWGVLLFAFIPLSFVFQNCGRGFKVNGSAVSLSFCKLQPTKTSPFASSKVRVKKQFFSSGLQKLSPNKTKLSLVVDVACLKDSPEEEHLFIDQEIKLADIQTKLRKAAITLQPQTEYALSDLEAAIDENPCFLGIAENPRVKRAQASMPVNDPQASQQQHLNFVGHAESRVLQDQITQKVVVAFVDSGIDYDHPELSSRMWTDANGFHGYNFVARNNQPLDDDGHGTHVAGLVAAIENNSVGVAGLTGDYVEIMAVKVLDNAGAGSSQNVHDGIDYAVQNGADIINLSVESLGQNTLMETAIIDAINQGVVVIAATGNQGSEITASNLYAPAYIGPSLNGAISVASVDTQNAALSNFSNYSATYAEISAPGAENSANINGGLLSTALGGGWTRIRGTSQATPIVTAAAAILVGYLKTRNVTYTPTGIENFLKSDGKMTRPGLVPYVDGGDIINIGFLSRNLNDYFTNSATRDDQRFSGDETTGNTCVIK